MYEREGRFHPIKSRTYQKLSKFFSYNENPGNLFLSGMALLFPGMEWDTKFGCWEAEILGEKTEQQHSLR